MTDANQIPAPEPCDIFVIGGGVNGCGIARDAAGRGYRVTLAEMGDLAQATSSASSKMFHGGLRYLEYFEFRLVREALHERETLLVAMPHIAWPLRFVLPLSPEMQFDGGTPAARLLHWVMPWLKGRRPDWLIRLGLFLYDSMGGRKILPATGKLDLRQDPAGRGLKPGLAKAYEYSDVWVQDARLVVLNARDAGQRGAQILTRTRVTQALRNGGLWEITTEGPRGVEVHQARALVNAAGPWVAEVLRNVTRTEDIPKAHDTTAKQPGVRLVRGSHIVTRRLFSHDRACFLQGPDGRVVFILPFEGDFSLIGTTDKDHAGPPGPTRCTDEERDYLLTFVNRWLAQPISAADVVWSYAGLRPLYDDGAKSASAATREYVLALDQAGAPLLNVFGGKITTYRRLAEAALAKLTPLLPQAKPAWTARVPLPGGDFPHDGVPALVNALRTSHPFLSAHWAHRLVTTYGTDAGLILGDATTPEALGRDFGATLTETEIRWQIRHEFARSAEDVIWRRSKLGLRLSAGEVQVIQAFIEDALHEELPTRP